MELDLSNKQKGAIVEQIITAEAVRLGIEVYRPAFEAPARI